MMRSAWVAVVLLLAASWAECSPGRTVAVGLFRAAPVSTVIVSGSSGLTVSVVGSAATPTRPGTGVTVSSAGTAVEISFGAVRKRRAHSVEISPLSAGAVVLASDRLHRSFRGIIRIRARSGRLVIVNVVPLEDYLRSVVPDEMNSDWPAEALKAQAVVTRTLALYRLGAHRSDGFDLCDTTHCQVYRGRDFETASTNAAVAATRGRVLLHSGRPVNALYSSTCGGTLTASYGPRRVEGAPYLAAKPDTLNGELACKSSHHYRWQTQIKSEDLRRALSTDKRTNPGSRLAGIRVTSRDGSGRAQSIEITGSRTHLVDGPLFMNVVCRKLGWARIKSTSFRVSTKGSAFVFDGSGLGHGMGMCQWGARARALAGWDYRRILAFYYPRCNAVVLRR